MGAMTKTNIQSSKGTLEQLLAKVKPISELDRLPAKVRRI